MKNLMHINEFLKMYENNSSKLFSKETELKNYLLNNEDFANNEVVYAFSDMGYDKLRNDKDWRYDKIVDYMSEFGLIPLFCTYFSSYNGQVCNGGHSQYFTNGYASSESRGAFGTYRDIDKHERFIYLFEELDLQQILPSGKEALDIISSFEFDPDNKQLKTCPECSGNGDVECSSCEGNGYIDCPDCNGEGEIDDETCQTCNGNGNIECEECDGRGSHKCEECDGEGEVEDDYAEGDNETWSKLDSRWYDINDQFKDELEDYIKSLTLDGEKISDLIPLAKEIQKYQI